MNTSCLKKQKNFFLTLCVLISAFTILHLNYSCIDTKIHPPEIHVTISKDNGNKATGFFIAWKEGSATDKADKTLWYTERTNTKTTLDIYPGPPYPFEKVSGDRIILTPNRYERDMTIFVLLDDGYIGKTSLEHLQPNDIRKVSISCYMPDPQTLDEFKRTMLIATEQGYRSQTLK